MQAQAPGMNMYELYRRQAAEVAAAETAKREAKPAPTPAPGSVEWSEMMKNRQSPKPSERP
jgi:hypothetical protein